MYTIIYMIYIYVCTNVGAYAFHSFPVNTILNPCAKLTASTVQWALLFFWYCVTRSHTDMFVLHWLSSKMLPALVVSWLAWHHSLARSFPVWSWWFHRKTLSHWDNDSPGSFEGRLITTDITYSCFFTSDKARVEYTCRGINSIMINVCINTNVKFGNRHNIEDYYENVQIYKSISQSTCCLSCNTPLRTEMSRFLFWMVPAL